MPGNVAEAEISDEVAAQRASRTSDPGSDLGELQKRAERIQRDVQELAETLGTLQRSAPFESGEASGPGGERVPENPLRLFELAAACRAEGRADEALRHAVQAADLLRAAGCTREARESLDDSTTGLEGLSSHSLELLSRAWEQLEDPARAAAPTAAAAEQHREEGRIERALALCRHVRSLDRDAEGLHRTWGLALLSQGDPEGALGHVARWRRQEPDDVDARIWYAQVLVESGATEEALESIRELATWLGLSPGQSLPIAGMRERIVERAKRSSYVPEAPFWENEAIVGSPGDVDEAARDRSEAAAAGDATQRRPRVFLLQDTQFHRMSLSEILAGEGIDVLRSSAMEGVLDRLRREVLPVDLLVLPLAGGSKPDYEFLAELRRIPGMEQVPIVGVATLDRSGVDRDRLQSLGVEALIDKNATPEQVAFRVNNLVRPSEVQRRRDDRAPGYFAVDLEAGTTVSTEYATNLSCGGVSVLSSRALAPKTQVKIRFLITSDSRDLIEIAGTVVRSDRVNRRGERLHRLGIAFEPLEPHHQQLVEAEVQRLLSISEW